MVYYCRDYYFGDLLNNVDLLGSLDDRPKEGGVLLPLALVLLVLILLPSRGGKLAPKLAREMVLLGDTVFTL